MPPTVREIHGDEMFDIMHKLPGYAFRSSPPLPDKAERRTALEQRVGDRFFAIFEDGAAVACAGVSPFSQNVRGALYAMVGLHNVTTDPAGRRRGYARRMLAEALSVLRKAGFVFSCLYPFRESFYERLGYVTFPLPRRARLVTANLAPVLKLNAPGAVQRCLMGDGYEAYVAYCRQRQRSAHGMAVLDGSQAFLAQQNRHWLALAVVGDQPVGLMVYDMQGTDLAQFTMHVGRFYYENSVGRYLLLDWIARHIDQAVKAEIRLGPAEQPETWLADMQVSLETAVRAPMGRILDVGALSGMNAGHGGFSARIVDPLCHWNEGEWRFESAGGTLAVSKAGQSNCTLTIEGLTALVYGTHDAEDYALRGWGDPPLDVQATMRTMFPPQLPYLHEYF